MDRIIMIKITFYGFLLVNRPPFHYSSFDNCSSFSGHPFVLSLNVDGWSIASPFSRSFSFFSSEYSQKSFARPPSSRKYITRARKFIGTRSALTRGKRNRYRDKMVGNSQSAHPLDLDALPFLRSARVHRAKRGQRREQRISLVKRKRRKLSNGHKRVVPLDLSSIPSNLLIPSQYVLSLSYRPSPHVSHLPSPSPSPSRNA